MKMSLVFLYGLILIVVLFTFTVGGCTSLSTVAGKSTTSTPGGSWLREDATQSPLNSSGNQAQSINTPDYTGMTTPPSNINQFVKLAEQDLATRLKVGIDEISLLKITDIDWQDLTQGCAPTPGKTLNKGKLSGYRIWLEVHGKEYVYHIGLDGKTYLCPN